MLISVCSLENHSIRLNYKYVEDVDQFSRKDLEICHSEEYEGCIAEDDGDCY